MNVMLLAAGEGTRLRPYTAQLPKPAIPFLTVPLAAHALGFLGDIAIERLVVNTFYLPEKIHELFKHLPHSARELHFSDEIGQILGSGGGLKKAHQHFRNGGDLLMMNADEVILPQDPEIVQKALNHHRQQSALATLMVMDHPGVGTQFGGVWTDANNKVLGFGKSPIPGAVKAWHFVGAQILSESVFDYILSDGESNILYDVLTSGIQNGQLVQVFPFDCAWFETGNPGDFLEAAKICGEHLASTQDSFQKSSLQKTLKKFSHTPVTASFKDSCLLICAGESQISPTAKIHGLLCLGHNAVIEDSCELENVIINSGIRIPAGTKAKNTLFL